MPDFTYTNLGETLKEFYEETRETRKMKELFNVYKATKAYAAGGGSLAGVGLAKPLVGIFIWIISLTGLQVPEQVEGYFITLAGALVAYLATWLVPNQGDNKEQ